MPSRTFARISVVLRIASVVVPASSSRARSTYEAKGTQRRRALHARNEPGLAPGDGKEQPNRAYYVCCCCLAGSLGNDCGPTENKMVEEP